METTAFSIAFNSAMKKRGLNPADIAKATGATYHAAWTWCAGVRRPRLESLATLADAVRPPMTDAELGELVRAAAPQRDAA